MFITFEGSEGAGKSTQATLLRDALGTDRCLLVREPGGTPLGEEIRRLLLHSEPMSAEAEMLLFMAARAELLEKAVKPALAAGGTVIADRYHDSTLAYQGGGRGCATWWPETFPRPGVTFLLRLPPELGLKRALAPGQGHDRLESEEAAFHGRVSEAYDELARLEPGRFRVLDATLPVDEIHQAVLTAVREQPVGAK